MYFGERKRKCLIFRISIWSLTLALHVRLEKVLRSIAALNGSRQNLRNVKVKYTQSSSGICRQGLESCRDGYVIQLLTEDSNGTKSRKSPSKSVQVLSISQLHCALKSRYSLR